MAITHHDTNVAGTGALPVDTLDADPTNTHRARQVVSIGHPDGALAGQYWLPDSHGSGPVGIYDTSGNALLTNPTDAAAVNGLLAVMPMRWNGLNCDRYNNANQVFTLIGLGARTTTAVGTFTNYNWAGIALALNVTSIQGGTPSLQVYLQAAGGILCPLEAAVTATGLYVYVFAPGSTATPYGSVNGAQAIHAIALPGGQVNPVVVFNPSAGNSITYSLNGYPILFS